MNIIRKIILFIKNIFIKQDKVKKLVEPKNIVKENKRQSFIESLKTTTTEKRTKKRVETLTCAGDGLGIQKNITY